jgi:hypothetical protein
MVKVVSPKPTFLGYPGPASAIVQFLSVLGNTALAMKMAKARRLYRRQRD